MVPLWCLIPLIILWVAACIMPYYWAKQASKNPQYKPKRTPQDECDDRFWETIAVIDAIEDEHW